MNESLFLSLASNSQTFVKPPSEDVDCGESRVNASGRGLKAFHSCKLAGYTSVVNIMYEWYDERTFTDMFTKSWDGRTVEYGANASHAAAVGSHRTSAHRCTHCKGSRDVAAAAVAVES